MRREGFLTILALGAAFSAAALLGVENSSATIVGFNAGRIIDDAVFVNKASMSVGDIQTFLNSKVPTCDTQGTQMYNSTQTRAQFAATIGQYPPFTCLKDYSENGLSAAQIVYNTAQQYSINPQVLIVLLQKEQGLVTDTWPYVSQYQKATGYGCPDTGSCNTAYYGFTNQLTKAANMYRKILDNSPDWYTPYILGNNYIQYNPNAACGGGVVNIENRSTQALYNYTPYQPNQAALDAGWGTVPCGAYGNRNFYLYFTSWFGATTGPDYAAYLKTLGIYSDTLRTTNLPTADGRYFMQPSQTAYLTSIFTNIGRANWDTNTRLGTTSPQDRISVFRDSSWESQQRAASISETGVAPNYDGRFSYSMTAPQAMGSYSESFGVVQDGKMWTNGSFTLLIDVVQPVSLGTDAPSGTVPSDAVLRPGQSVLSPDRYTSLKLEPDGRLVLRRDFKVVWSTPAAGTNSSLVMQSDGNLVLYNANGAAVWNSETNGRGTSRLVVQEDGNLVLYNTSGPTWWTGTNYSISHLKFTTYRLYTNGVILPGQGLETASRSYQLYLQSDGNLVLYSKGKAVWATGTNGKDSAYLVMQSDGNLVLYDKNNRALWSNGRSSSGTTLLNLQEDANLVTYNSTSYTWATWTQGH